MLSVESAGKSVPREEKISLKVNSFMQFSHSYQNPGVLVARDFIDGLQTHTFRLTLPLRTEIT